MKQAERTKKNIIDDILSVQAGLSALKRSLNDNSLSEARSLVAIGHADIAQREKVQLEFRERRAKIEASRGHLVERKMALELELRTYREAQHTRDEAVLRHVLEQSCPKSDPRSREVVLWLSARKILLEPGRWMTAESVMAARSELIRLSAMACEPGAS